MLQYYCQQRSATAAQATEGKFMTPLPYTPAPSHRNAQSQSQPQPFAYPTAAAAASGGEGATRCTCDTPGPALSASGPPILPTRHQTTAVRAAQQQRVSGPGCPAGVDPQQLVAPFTYTLTVCAALSLV